MSAELVPLYRAMLQIREVEERLYALFAEGKLYGTTHASTGQEAIAVGVVDALDRDRDVVTSNHRGHGHFLAYCDDVEGLLAEIMGKDTGVCRGWGGSQHLHTGNLYSNGVLGSMIPIGVGMAHEERARGTGAIVCNFLGDGMLGEGVVYESLNLVGLWRLPSLFCVENNHYQQAVALEKAAAGSLADRGRAFGLRTLELDGNDVVAIREAMGEVVERVRGGEPHWVVFDTYRQCGHSKSDDCSYRTREEEAAWSERDPIARLAERLEAGERERVRDEVLARIDAAVAAADGAPPARLRGEDGR